MTVPVLDDSRVALASRDPGGELRFMTVLFADLAGFTSFAEDRSPDEVGQIVGDLLQRLGKSTFRALHVRRGMETD